MERNTNRTSTSTRLKVQFDALQELPLTLQRVETCLRGLSERESSLRRLEASAHGVSSSLLEIEELKSTLQAALSELNGTLKTVEHTLQRQTVCYLDLIGELQKQRESQESRTQWSNLLLGFMAGVIAVLLFQ